MNLEDLHESLEEVFGVGNFAIDYDNAGQLIVYTGLKISDDDEEELVPCGADDEDEEGELEIDPDFEPLADEDDGE